MKLYNCKTQHHHSPSSLALEYSFLLFPFISCVPSIIHQEILFLYVALPFLSHDYHPKPWLTLLPVCGSCSCVFQTKFYYVLLFLKNLTMFFYIFRIFCLACTMLSSLISLYSVTIEFPAVCFLTKYFSLEYYALVIFFKNLTYSESLSF